MDGVYYFALMVIGLGVFVASYGLAENLFDYLEINECRFAQRFVLEKILGMGITVIILVLLSCLFV